ncbi:MAG TPA: Flp family type IVb pilin [Bdellovibrionota bacterium]|nr:Flp family type IVb pilin [Bdellovibrionota bacterium]
MKIDHSIRNESGQGLTEYLMIMILVAVISIAAVKSLGSTVKSKIQDARKHINEDITFRE